MPLPLVLLPGMNCSPRLWDWVVEELETGKLDGGTAEVVIEHLDQPSIDGQVDALLDRLPRRFALGGLSLGAIVAMAVHRRAPERVGGLCLVATNSRAPTVEQHAAWRAQLELLGSGATARDLQDHLIPLLLGDHLTPALRRLTLDMADEVGSDRLAAQLRLQLTRVDERPGLHAATIPCVVVAAADDQICPLNRHTEISELVPGSQLVVVADAPHLVTLSHPQRVAEALAVWLHRLG